jgi:hypothetical protein
MLDLREERQKSFIDKETLKLFPDGTRTRLVLHHKL